MWDTDILAGLLEGAYHSLFKNDDEDYIGYNYVKLLVEKPMSDTFSFHLYNSNDTYLWERKIWNKQSDNSKIDTPIDTVKYIREKIIPNIMEQKGTTDLKDAKEIFASAKLLCSINNKVENSLTQIDCTAYYVQIKNEDIVKEFKWNQLPKEWNDVAILSSKIIELNNRIY